MRSRLVTCAALAANPDKIAPVSGCRCRECGANANNRPLNEQWLIKDSAAWCAECVFTWEVAARVAAKA
jgi:hypothetical protein